MNLSLNRKKAAKEGQNPIPDSDERGMSGSVVQFYVFFGEKYLGWDCFDTHKVRVGKSPSADLVLNDETLDGIQAEFLIKGGRIMVSECGKKGALTVNNKAVSHCIVGALDVVKIGTYTIKTKLKGIETLSESDHAPVTTSEPDHTAVTNTEPERKPVIKKEIQAISAAPASATGPEPLDTLSKSLKTIMNEDDLEMVDVEGLFTEEPEHQVAADEDISDHDMWGDTEDLTEMVTLSDLFDEEDDNVKHDQELPKPVVQAEKAPVAKATRSAKDLELSWSEFTSELPVEPQSIQTAPVEIPPVVKAVEKSPKPKQSVKAKPAVAKTADPEIKNTFPPSFFKVIEDEEDKEEEDFPASFSLRDKLIGKERNLGRTSKGEKVIEIITLRKDNVLNIKHLKGDDSHVLIDDKTNFCRVNHDEKQGLRLVFSEPLLGTINRTSDNEFKAEKQFSAKGLLSGNKTYCSALPTKGELILSDGFYDYVLRQSFRNATPLVRENQKENLPLPKRVVKSTAFKYASRAVGFHIILMIILSYSITMPDKTEYKNPETYFVMVETENIHKPVKPKPKPVIPAPIPKKVEKVKKELPKEGTQVASLRPKKTETKPKDAGAPEAGGGHKGTVVNRNVNDMGLLATLGMKTGIEIKPNDALASVTNMDAITSSHASEARIKVGGLVGDLGDGRMAIPTGGVINNKGAADVLRSAGIGGKGTVAALQNGNTGKREVSGAVSAPLTKKVKFKGGGISREAVAKVINDHIDEINYCYETALINDPTLMGKIEFEWVILLSGEVGEVRIKSSTVKSNEIHSCIKSAIRTWTFPKPKGSAVEVSYPFVFDVSGF